MLKRRRTPDDFDCPWKDALQAYLPAFLTFFFTDILEDGFWNEIDAFEKERAVECISSVERIGMKKGTARWIVRGTA